MPSITDTLSSALGDFKRRLDSKPVGKVETTVQNAIEVRTTSFDAKLSDAPPSSQTANGRADNSDQQNPPVQPKPSACFGFGTGNVTLAISGVISCPPGDTADPNGVFSLPYFTSGTGFCQWLLISGGFQYSFVLASDGTVSATIQDTIAGNFYFQCDPVAYGTTMNDTIDLPCIPGDPATRGYGGSATASF